MKDCKKDCKSLANRCELQIRTSALNSVGANSEEPRVKGEALNHHQSKIGLSPEGGKYELKASYFGTGLISDVQRFVNHSINTVIKKLEEENKK